jgi:hypothetical protein
VYFLLISVSLERLRLMRWSPVVLLPVLPVCAHSLSAAAGKPVFMRVRENLPPFTLRLLNVFVNSKSRVSTGFWRFS